MPVPPLPFEVISLIADELRTSSSWTDDVHSTGVSIALVYRAWQSLGENIAWYRLALESTNQARRAIERFKAVPRLARAVQHLDLPHTDWDNDTEPSDAGEGDPEEPLTDEEELALWSAFPCLRALDWDDVSWIGPHLIFSPDINRERLESFVLNTYHEEVLSHRDVFPFVASCPRLTRLKLDCVDPTVPVRPPPHSLPPLSLRQLHLNFSRFAPPPLLTQTPTILSHLFLASNPLTLTDLDLPINIRDFDFLDRIFASPVLRRLNLRFPAGGPIDAFVARAWQTARQHPTLQYLSLSLKPHRFGDPDHLLNLPDVPDLDTFLRSFPSTCKHVVLERMAFPASVLPPLQRLPPPNIPPETASSVMLTVRLKGREEDAFAWLFRDKESSKWFEYELRGGRGGTEEDDGTD